MSAEYEVTLKWFHARAADLDKSPGWFNADELDAVARAAGAEPHGVWHQVEPGHWKVLAVRP